jgi:release factor glutamine methyltransferase
VAEGTGAPQGVPGATRLREALQAVAGALAQSLRLEDEVRADAVREARMLAAGVLGVSPGEVARRLAADATIAPDDARRLGTAAGRRATGEPLAYCVGTAAFRELDLAVDARVLVPRPETEVVVGEALRLVAGWPGGIAVDIGTGSGAIALSLAHEGHFSRVLASDVSADALAVARANADRLGLTARVEFRLGTDLAPFAELKHPGAQARVIVSNPPYIAYQEAASLPGSVRDWEPPVALYADREGMARYDVIIAGAPPLLEPGGWLVLEVDARRAGQTAELAITRGYQQVQLVRDLAGRERVLIARWTS